MKIDRLRTFMSRDKDRPRVIVALDTSDGITGWGECYNHGPDRALKPISEYLFAFLQGKDPRRIEFLIQYLMQQSRFPPGRLPWLRSQPSITAFGIFQQKHSTFPSTGYSAERSVTV